MLGQQRVALWTTAGRPASPVKGAAGYNTELNQLEIYTGSAWKKVALTNV